MRRLELSSKARVRREGNAKCVAHTAVGVQEAMAAIGLGSGRGCFASLVLVDSKPLDYGMESVNAHLRRDPMCVGLGLPQNGVPTKCQ